MKKILILTDNEILLDRFCLLLKTKSLDVDSRYSFEFAYSAGNKAFSKTFHECNWIRPLSVKAELDSIISNGYFLIISLHCKQLFPKQLVAAIKCINVHPGFNPFNRGWYPQVFSIINELPCGATIHEIDDQLDHGPIICQKMVDIESWDTSLSVYDRILDAEMELLAENIESILQQSYSTFQPDEGNLNLKSDFELLCNINLQNVDTFKNHINTLRALSHGHHTNAFMVDERGNRVYLKIKLTKE